MNVKSSKIKWFLGVTFLGTVFLTFFVGYTNKTVTAQYVPDEELYEQIIVKLKPEAAAWEMEISGAAAKMSYSQAQSLSVSAGIEITGKRAMSGGAQVMKLPYPMTKAEVDLVIAGLQDDPDVSYAEIDVRLHAHAGLMDTYYMDQWHYHDATTEVGAANLPGAWAEATGDASIVVAVIDTGLVAHSDLDPDITDATGSVVPGYDFIYYTSIANDGDSRDSDPSDPGDWDPTGDWCNKNQSSSWHGTHVAGTIGAITNNNNGVSGVNWNSKILPVRVLGRCGGLLSDIADAIRWSAGHSVSGVPLNSNPAKVLNISLGATSSCSTTMQDAIDAAVSAGSTVVVSAGNDTTDANTNTPANCNNVITVAAVARDGDRASYSNVGSTVEISAPGGEGTSTNAVYSTSNSGSTVPSSESYEWLAGTSMAAPHVSGIASLLLSKNSNLTPSQVLKILENTARDFPAGATECNTAICGAGIVDAHAALTEPTALIETSSTTYVNNSITLNGSNSFIGSGYIEFYLWQQTSGTAVSISDATDAVASFVAPSSPETLVFRLDVTDDEGLSHFTTMSVSISNPPSSSGGGGGGGGGCFIATAAYGTSMEPDVRHLRAFRDEYLLSNKPGQLFVDFYYDYSPPVADTLREYSVLRAIVRGSLKPLVWLSEALVSNEVLALQTAEAP